MQLTPELLALVDRAEPALRESLPVVFSASDFVAQSCARDPQLIAADLQKPLSAEEFALRTPQWESDAAPLEAQLMTELRHWRRREMVRIAWRDIAGWAPLHETLAGLSAFADAAIGAAYRHARRLLSLRYGEPRSASGEIQPLVVLGMGKLGGRELNFSSDVDLIFLFPEHGATDGARDRKSVV